MTGEESKPFEVATLPAAAMAVGASLFISFFWYLLTWVLPGWAGWLDLRDRLNPFVAVPASGIASLLDPVFVVNLIGSNAIVLGVPSFFSGLIHKGSPLMLPSVICAAAIGLNLAVTGHNLDPSVAVSHRVAYVADMALAIVAVFAATLFGSAVSKQLQAGVNP